MDSKHSNKDTGPGGETPRTLADHVRAAWQACRSFTEAAPPAYLKASGQCWAELTESDFEAVSGDWVASWQRLQTREQGDPSPAELGRVLRPAQSPAERLVAYAAAVQVVGTESAGDRVLLANTAEHLGVQGLLRRHVEGACQRHGTRPGSRHAA